MLLKNKLDNIKTLLEADNVLATVEERYCYASDASNNLIDGKSMEHLAIYQQDLYHCTVVKPLMHEIRCASVAVDYEVE